MLAATIGGITFFLAACGAFLELQAALNTIWRVTPAPSGHVKAFLLDRIRSFGLVVAIGFLLLVSLAVSAALSALAAWLDRWAPGIPMVLYVVNFIVSLAVTSVLFGLLFKFLPDVELAWPDVATGAVVTGLLFAIGKHVIGLYLGPGEHDLELRRCWVGHRPSAVGVLLLPNPAHRGGVHEALCRTCAWAGTGVAFRGKDQRRIWHVNCRATTGQQHHARGNRLDRSA